MARRKRHHRKVRRNPDGNMLLYVGGAVGLYFAYRWWSARRPSAATTSNAQIALSDDQAWARYQASQMYTQSPSAMKASRGQFQQFWGALTPSEKSTAVTAFGLTSDQMMANTSLPWMPVFTKLYSAIPGAAPVPPPSSPPPAIAPSGQSGPGTPLPATSGFGSYYN